LQACAVQHLLRLRIQLEPREHFLMADTAAWIRVHDVNELRNRVLAVTHDVSGGSASRRYQFAVHYEQAMVIPLEERLHDHGARMLPCDQKTLRDFLIRGEPDGDSATVVTVVRFGHYRETDATRGSDGRGLCLYELLDWHRQPESGEDFVGFLLVAGQLHGNMGRSTGDRRLDTLLVFSVAELDE